MITAALSLLSSLTVAKLGCFFFFKQKRNISEQAEQEYFLIFSDLAS